MLTKRDPLEPSLAAGHLLLPHSTRRRPLLASAAAAHVALSVSWTGVLARLPSGTVTGAVAGAAIAALDLGTARVIGGPRFGPTAALPVLPQLADHLAFGAIAGWALGQREAQVDRPSAVIRSS
jgi:hypothetical protein